VITDIGSYTFSATDASGALCPGSLCCPIVVARTPLPTITASTPNSICKGASATLTATGTGTYKWSDAAASTTATISVSPTANTVYTVTLTDAKGCVNTDTVNVIVNNLPTIVASTPNSICKGASATLTATGTGTYKWSDAAASTTATISVSPTANTVYTVTLTDAKGCVNTDTVNVIVNNLPTITASTPGSICKGTSATLTATGTGTYKWSDAAASTTATISVSPTANTVYTVTLTDAKGCVNTDTVNVFVSTPVSAGTTSVVPNICINSGLASVNLLSKITGYSATTGTWTQTSGPATGASFNAAGGIFNPNGLVVGTYVFRYTLTGTYPCPSDTEDVTIIIERCCPVNICLPITYTIKN
jgi:3-dehydroquinate dehydratase